MQLIRFLPRCGLPIGLRADRRGAVAVLLAVAAIPLTGMAGLAIDYGIWNQTYASLALAASAAALNAAKTAGSALLASDSNYAAEGTTAGLQWFSAELVQSAYTATAASAPAVSITTTSSAVSAQVSYTGTVPSIFGKLFRVGSYPISVSASAAVPIAPYLEVIMLLDNSSSMDIGATDADIAKLSSLSPCDSSNAFYGDTAKGWTNKSKVSYGVYACTDAGNTYDGATACPVAIPSAALAGYTLADAWGTAYFPTHTWQAYPPGTSTTCHGALPLQSNGTYPLIGPPCAFACHWATAKNADGTTQDLYGMARRYGITLRFDLVKSAANATLQAMAQQNIPSLNNLTVGIYTFNSSLTQIYPTNCPPGAAGCEAGQDFAAAESLVGTGDAGIPAVLGIRTGNNDDTDFPDAMSGLQSYVTAAGDGSAPAAPKKILIIVTDGMQDDPVDGSRQAFNPAYCQNFKSWGYTVYVAYTPYYPVMHTYYLDDMIPIVEGSGPASIGVNLLACSSGTSAYISAADGPALNAALLSFLKFSLNVPARFTY